MERWYAVTVETWGEIAPERLDDETDTLIDALSALGASGPSLSAGGLAGGWALTVSVTAPDADQAVALGMETLRDAAAKAGVELSAVARVDVMDEAYQERFIEEPPIALVGVSEIAELLGVSRQRIRELRLQPGFPEPITELKAGPVWSRPALDRFLRGWPRRPGRRRDLRGAISTLHTEMLRSVRTFQVHTRDERAADPDAIMRPLRDRYPEIWHDQAELQRQLDDLVRERLLEVVPSEAVPRMGTYRLTPDAWRFLDELDAENPVRT